MAKTPVTERVLNEEQRQAVEFGEGPLLIIAGAGTGKTTVVTERIKHLITSGRCRPDEILALTFTDKASREMEERVDLLVPYGYTQMWISTFHSFCDRILRQEAVHVGLNPAYKLMSDADVTMIIRKNLFAFDLDYFRPLGNPTKFIGGMINHFSRLRDEDVNPGQYLAWVKSQTPHHNIQTQETIEENKKYSELANAFKTYEDLKVTEGFMDFSDLIGNTLKLFRERKNIRRQYQDQFRYLIVDEFQDTNIAQNELLLLLAGETQNITAVADDDQCLPEGTFIDTPGGAVPIETLGPGNVVITAVGKGYLSTSKILHIQKNEKNTRFITFITESNQKLTVTDNHKLFCMNPGKKFGKKQYYVYIMERKNLGWRIGITDDLAQRLRLERSADRILAIMACKTAEEAHFYETVYALRYGIPQYPFKPRKQMILTGKWLQRLFYDVDSRLGVKRLADDLGIDISSHHFCLGGVVRGHSERVKVRLRMCVRRYTTKWATNRILINPKVCHEVRLETSSLSIVKVLTSRGIPLRKRKNCFLIRKQFQDIQGAGIFARELCEITGAIFEATFDIGKRNTYSRTAMVMPAANVLVGMSLPVRKNFQLVYERIIQRTEERREATVYDLEVQHTHNYIANSVAVHNSIYKFRGAAVSNVISFRKHFPQAKLIVLSKNYRSTQTILDTSYQLIQYNNPDRLEVKEGISKKLTSAKKLSGSPIQFIHADRVENEADAVAREIQSLHALDAGSLQWKEAAILVRANNHAEPFVRALGRYDIPYQFLGPGQLFRQPEIKELIAYLQVLANFDDNVALFKILTMNFFSLTARDLAAVANMARKYNITLFEACEAVTNVRPIDGITAPNLPDTFTEKLTKIISMIHRHLALVPKESGGQILYYFLQDTGMLKHILDYSYPLDERKAANISKFFNKLKTYEAGHEDAAVRAVLDWITLAMELGESPLANDTDWVNNDAVNILTVHSAKGLEFRAVFLVNLVAQRFPTVERREQIPIPQELIKEELPEGDYHMEEERRLFYVGMTRARDYLYFTAANFYGEGVREKKVSPFVYEALGDEIQSAATGPESGQLPLLDWEHHGTPAGNTTNGHTVTYLSYSQIDAFRLCPLHYKLRYILNIQPPVSPALSFGSTIHSTLKDVYRMVKAREKVSKDTFLELMEKNWIREGYTDKKYENAMKRRGREYLTKYFEVEFDPGTDTLLLEQPFTVPIQKGGKRLKVGGRIDRIDTLGNGKIEIIDYKTGRIPLKREADANLQLSLYAIAATEIPDPPFGRNTKDITLTLYYFDSQQKISTTRTKEQLEAEKETIFTIAEEIEHSDFRCSGNQLCTTCEYKMFCGITATP